MKNSIEIFQDLGLLYVKHSSPLTVSSMDPNEGELNLEKALANNPECWDRLIPQPSQQAAKTIFLNDAWETHDLEGCLKSQIVRRLLDAGFIIYYRAAGELKRLESLEDLDSDAKTQEMITPTQQSLAIKGLGLTRDQIAVIDHPFFVRLCSQILSVPDFYFYFINFLSLENPQYLFDDIQPVERVSPDYQSAMEWEFKPLNASKTNWHVQHELFEDKINADELGKRLLDTPPDHSSEGDNLRYLSGYFPNLLKSLTYLTLANVKLSFTKLFKQTENLVSLSLKNCAILDEKISGLSATLQHLELVQVSISTDFLFSLVQGTSNLNSLSLCGGEIINKSAFKPIWDALPHLNFLYLSDELKLSLGALFYFLNNAPHLEKLHLANVTIKNITTQPFTYLPVLEYLKELNIHSTLDWVHVMALLNKLPHLESLILSNITSNGSHSLSVKLTALREITLTRSSVSPLQLRALLQNTSDILILRFVASQLSGADSLGLEKNSLSALQELNLTSSEFSSLHLHNLLEATPNLETLSLEKPEDFGDFLKRAKNSAYPSLNYVYFPSDPLSSLELTELIRVAPYLKSILFLSPATEAESVRIEWIRHSYPDIEIALLEKKHDFEPDFDAENFIPPLDGKLSKEQNSTFLPGRTLFKAKEGQAPNAQHYHLNSFYWAALDKRFKRYAPNSKSLCAVPSALKSTTEAMDTLFNAPETPQEYLYGSYKIAKPDTSQWFQLPAVSATDELIFYDANCPEIQIRQDTIFGYYFFKIKQPCDIVLINFIIKPGQNFHEIEKSETPLHYLKLLSQCVFDPSGLLANTEDYQKILALDLDKRIKLITGFCQFKDAFDNEDTEGDTLTVFNELIKRRKGLCRHRAQLFVALATSFNIEARLIINDVHEFIRVKNSDGYCTLNLGGGDIEVIQLPMTMPQKERPGAAQAEIKKKQAENIPPPDTNNPFQIWNTPFIEGSLNNGVFNRRWLILKEPQGIDAIHQSSLLAGNTYFSRDLDSLVLSSIHVKEGVERRVDSPLVEFLKKAAHHPAAPYIWFINWSDPKSHHTCLNSVIDNEVRHLLGFHIPCNIQIVALSDAETAATMDDDFSSRFDSISQLPTLLALSTPPAQAVQPIKPLDVIFPSLLGWESVLLGQFTFNDGVFDIHPGPLLDAAKNKISKLTLHNAPWEDSKFRFFINELLARKAFFYNGEWHTLAKNFSFEYALPDLSTYPPIVSPAQIPNQTMVLNQTTYPLLFRICMITALHTLKTKSGFLRKDKALTLLITDNLSEIQWYFLLKEAQIKSCALTIKVISDVFVPQPLIKQVKVIPPLKSSNRLIIAGDLDDAEACYKREGAITINVDLKTTFNSLFYHVSLNNRHFTGKATALLDAIKTGSPVILKGHFSKTLAEQLHSAFAQPSSLLVNGKRTFVQNLTIISCNPDNFKAIHATQHIYRPENDFSRLEPELSARLCVAYQRLNLTPCHSHFHNLPADTRHHAQWCEQLIQNLALSSGQYPSIDEPTTPKLILSTLKKNKLIFLLSETGEGKSHFVQRTLTHYAREQGQPITIYYGLNSVNDWLLHKDPNLPLLFIDEANLNAEDYALFEAVVRRDKHIWFQGEKYPLEDHALIFAGNFKQEQGRVEPDLLRRYPVYCPFKGIGLERQLAALLNRIEDSKTFFALICGYYSRAKDAGLNISARNAQMMCLRYFLLKSICSNLSLPDEFLMRYAILSEIKVLGGNKGLILGVCREIKNTPGWANHKKHISEAKQHSVSDTSKQFVWTSSRQKIAFTIDTLLWIRDKKIKGDFKQGYGVNGLILESESGLGKSHLVSHLLTLRGCDFVVIKNCKSSRNQLIDAFHKGQLVILDEFNTRIDEEVLNALLSGYDLHGNSPAKSGFAVIGMQNPVTFHRRRSLSRPLDNRLMFVEMSDYKPDELAEILTRKYNLSRRDAVDMIEQYHQAKNYAKSQGFFPVPNSRDLMKHAGKRQAPEALLQLTPMC